MHLTELTYALSTEERHDQALPLFQRSLKISEKALGEEHPDVATGLNNLAELF